MEIHRARDTEMKYRLAVSLGDCMHKTSVDKITVKDIVEGCHVTRQTFYRHFKDKYDLINWYFDILLETSFEKMGQGNTVEESLTRKFAFIQSEKVFFKEAFRSDDYNSLKEHDFEKILDFYTRLIVSRTGQPLSKDLNFLLEMYCHGSIDMTVKWLLEGMNLSPGEMAVCLVEAIPPKLGEIMRQLGLI